MKNIFLYPVIFYRKCISPLKPPCCRFTPTCSSYFYKAINEWGALIGIPMGVWRILRCNPFCKGGEDGIPHRKRKLVPKTAVLTKRSLKKQNKKKMTYPFYFFYET